MVNNSTNINKIKENVNSDSQQFHQYQQCRKCTFKYVEYNKTDIYLIL